MANLEGMPISSLPETSFQNSDQVIGYRSETGKAYRASVGSLGEAAEENISDAFDESKEYSAGDYCIYNDTLYKFTADKTAGAWDESVVEKTNVGTEISQNASDISELNTALVDKVDSGDFVRATFVSDSFTLEANSQQTITIAVPMEGYTLLCGTPSTNSTSSFWVTACRVDSETRMALIVRNRNESSSVTGTYSVQCLYVRSTSNT